MGKSYVVVVGLKPGIYPNWIECNGQIKHVPGAVYQRFDTYEEAFAVWQGALQRGEVEAVRPNAGAASASATRIKNEMDGDMYQLVAPSRMDRAADACTVNMQPPQSLWDDMSLLHFPRQALSPEPPTGVAQYVDLQEVPWLQPERGLSPQVTLEDTSYTSSSSCINESSHLLTRSRPGHIRKAEASPTSSVMSIEETTCPRDLRRQVTAPASFEMGARYPTIEEICKGQNLDPRVMIPPSRTFDPANVKPRPGAVSARRKNGQTDAESTSPHHPTTHLVRNRLPAVNYSEDDGQSISSLPRHRVANKEKSRAPADAATEARASGYVCSDNQHSFSPYPYHVQEVYSLDRPEQRSVVVVHCPPGNGCCHRHCESVSACSTVMNKRTQSCYADVGVSPIISSVSLARTKSNVQGPGARASDASSGQGLHSFPRFSSTPHVSHNNYAIESDVRSPFARGTRIPSGLSELSIFGRPSPVMQGLPVRDRHHSVVISRA
ncbi:uncharacterized protein EDB93DRAFT_1181501 [Suillus bovinus]|uniref:uncharacterized protein n=1 Tax=Suillus bovinus TaxID=48563 RepID=UPI001B867357|nr:uncharacterized protein EDB93DRAFT_1181501 [Suillus bovinus]KAG2129816.1 hypothetical protein EDB93DRAFT_1181501 [Suillus bovinus]